MRRLTYVRVASGRVEYIQRIEVLFVLIKRRQIHLERTLRTIEQSSAISKISIKLLARKLETGHLERVVNRVALKWTIQSASLRENVRVLHDGNKLAYKTVVLTRIKTGLGRRV